VGIAVLFVLGISPCQIVSAASPAQRECERIALLSVSAARHRARGATKEQLLSVLPSLELSQDRIASSDAALLRAVREIADEVFDFPPVDETAYMVYKTEGCYLAASGSAAPKRYAAVHEKLRRCSALEGNELIACSMRVAGASDDGE
jgi:hypothetical protein